MKKSKRIALAFCLFMGLSQHLFSQFLNAATERQFTVPQLQHDFKVFRHKFESTLANLYLYTPKPQLDSIFDAYYHSISPMTEREFYNFITPLLSVIKDGHSLILPAAETAAMHAHNALYFPFQVYWYNGHLYTIRNFSADTSIADGSEIISINNKKTEDIIAFLCSRQVRDGENQTYPLWIINRYFRGYYGISFGYPERYDLILKLSDGTSRKYTVSGVSNDSIAIRKSTRYAYSNAINQQGIHLKVNGKTAVLSISTWDAKILRTLYHQQFKKEIDAAFQQIAVQKIEHLIIDIRDNQGGEAIYGDYLLGYLLQQPYQYTTGVFKVMKHGTNEQQLQRVATDFSKVHQPRKNNFKGMVYVLINGGSFSNSGIFSSRLQWYRRGVFIGEEAAGNKTVLTGVFGIGGKTILPNSKIICDRSNYRILISDVSANDGYGVVPDIAVTPSAQDIIQGRDPVMEKVMELIK